MTPVEKILRGLMFMLLISLIVFGIVMVATKKKHEKDLKPSTHSCPDGFVMMSNGQCAPGCAEGGLKCPSGTVCQDDTQCVYGCTYGAPTDACSKYGLTCRQDDTCAPSCSSTVPCGKGSECENGSCSKVCSPSDPCPTGYSCSSNGVCVLSH